MKERSEFRNYQEKTGIPPSAGTLQEALREKGVNFQDLHPKVQALAEKVDYVGELSGLSPDQRVTAFVVTLWINRPVFEEIASITTLSERELAERVNKAINSNGDGKFLEAYRHINPPDNPFFYSPDSKRKPKVLTPKFLASLDQLRRRKEMGLAMGTSDMANLLGVSSSRVDYGLSKLPSMKKEV